jgi:N utilization substance protein B
MRRRGRVCALQILYQMDLNRLFERNGRPLPPPSVAAVDQALQLYWENFDPVDPADQAFAERLVHGAAREIAELDAALAGASHHWKVTRMDKVDRNLLRLGAYEILRCADIPRSASINEAIEIAKRFSGNDSAKFINGVLDQLHREPGTADTGGSARAGSDADADALAEAELDRADSMADVLPLALHAARRKPT